MLKASTESPRMFDSDLFDFFSRVPAWVVPVIYLPIIAALIVQSAVVSSGWLWIPVQFAAGVAVWSLMEYWLHRTLFHWVPATSWGPRFHFLLHGVHHVWVDDKYRLVMPPAASLGLAVPVFGIIWAAGQAGQLIANVSSTWIWAFFAGVVAGYLIYDMTHYYIHHFRPRSEFMKRLKAHHLAHHHNPRYKESKFGVSSTFWDHVFRTY